MFSHLRSFSHQKFSHLTAQMIFHLFRYSFLVLNSNENFGNFLPHPTPSHMLTITEIYPSYCNCEHPSYPHPTPSHMLTITEMYPSYSNFEHPSYPHPTPSHRLTITEIYPSYSNFEHPLLVCTGDIVFVHGV